MDLGYKDTLVGTSWLGEVVDVDDPEQMGRARVRVYGKFDELPTEDIPWASQASSFTAGSASGGGFLSVPKLGSVVAVWFPNGDLYHPEYRFSQAVSREAREAIGDSYRNAHVLLFDTVTEGGLKVYFTEADGLQLNYRDSVVRIRPNQDIEATNPDGDTVRVTGDGNVQVEARKKVEITCEEAEVHASKRIHLDCAKPSAIHLGKNVTDSIILGERFLALFNTHVHQWPPGGVPSSPPLVPVTGPQVLSNVVKTQ